MRRTPNGDALTEFGVAAFSGVAAVAGSYAVTGFTPAFVVAPVSSFVVDNTPAAVVAWSIQTLGDAGHLLGFGLALALTVGSFAAGALVSMRAADRVDVPAGGVLAAVAGWAIATALTGVAVPAIVAGVSLGAVVGVSRAVGTGRTGFSAARRSVLTAAAGAAALGGVGFILGGRASEEVPDSERSAEASSLIDDAEANSLEVEGLEGLVSEQFYEVDINSVKPTVNVDEWSLRITGAVDDEATVDYDDITAMPAERRFETLRCVGERLNGKKMDNALWTGVPITDVIEEAGVELDDCCVMLRAADDYFEEFPLDALRDGFLAYRMNGRPLPRRHGYPVRALIPGHWGEINVKWLTEIEVLEAEQKGFWEKRGWHGTGPVNTVAKLHAVNHLDGGRVQVGGHAYAGTRGIQRVEVSTDGGQSWTDATLSEPLDDRDVWRQWERTYEAAEPHEVVVRATDGEGTRQPRERHQAFPNGPTGWVSKRIEP